MESAVIKLQVKSEELTIDEYKTMLTVLDIISPYKRKTLGKIAKMTGIKIPEEYQGFRLEELGRSEMKYIIEENRN